MRDLRTVVRLELLLLARGRGLPIAAIFAALAGVWTATAIREGPWAAWGTLDFAAVLVSLVLALSTGDQVRRDHRQRLDAVLLSTPVSSTAYVWGKYLAALIVLLGLALVTLMGAVLMDRFDPWRDPPPLLQMGHAIFPPLGFRLYAIIWLLLMITPVVFGAAWMLAASTWSRGGRLAASIGALLLWLLPMLYYRWPQVLDVTGQRFSGLFDSNAAFKLAMTTVGAYGTWTPHAQARIMSAVQAALPPALPSVFMWNRVFFLCAAALLVALTAWHVGRGRQGQV